ncbi:MAG: methyltransferase domain-containing protein [Spirochaetota bacterium]
MSDVSLSTDRSTIGLIRAALSLGDYHRIMNDLYEEVFGEHQMVHFPYFRRAEETLLEGQANLTNVCLDCFGDLTGTDVLEVGCGNGVQSMFVATTRNPRTVTGLDINPANVALAERIAAQKQHANLRFIASDAQNMRELDDASFDAVLNVESAFHYPDKQAFLNEVSRVLKPGGRFVMADILMKPNRRGRLLRMWEQRLSQNYWFPDSYREAFSNAGLHIAYEEDITAPVMKGFQSRSGWFRGRRIRGRFRRALIMTFVHAQVSRHLYYLRNVCTYHVFSAVKAES